MDNIRKKALREWREEGEEPGEEPKFGIAMNIEQAKKKIPQVGVKFITYNVKFAG